MLPVVEERCVSGWWQDGKQVLTRRSKVLERKMDRQIAELAELRGEIKMLSNLIIDNE